MDGRLTARLWLPMFVLALAATAIPVLLTPMPPMLDYPNHFVRLWLLEGGADTQPVAGMYRIDWGGASTNIFIDLVAALAKGIVPVSIVGPAMLLLALLLPAIGIAAFARQIHGRLTWWHLLCVILGWSQIFLLGFVNFQIAIGLALLCAAGDARLAERHRTVRMSYGFVAAVALLLAHPFGLFFYAMLVGGTALGPRWVRGTSLRESLLPIERAILACLPLLLVVALFWLFASHPGDHQAGAPEATQWQSAWIVGKPSILLSPFKAYHGHPDFLFVAILAVPPIAALAGRRLRWHGGLLVAAALLALGSFLMPAHYLGTAFIDIRLPMMLWMTLAVALLPDIAATGSSATVAVLLALAVVFARAEGMGRIWWARRGDLEAIHRALARIPAGATVLPLVQTPDHAHIRDLPLGRAVGSQMDFWHLATLAIAERHAFVPTLFANPGKQVVQVRPPYASMAVPEGAIASVDRLGRPLRAADMHEFPYLNRWRCFDYILVTNADTANAEGAMPVLPQVSLLEDDGFARLYAIRHGGTVGCPVFGHGVADRSISSR